MPNIVLKELSNSRISLFKHALEKFVVTINKPEVAESIARRSSKIVWNKKDITELTSNLVPLNGQLKDSVFKKDLFTKPKNEATPDEKKVLNYIQQYRRMTLDDYLIWQQNYNNEHEGYNDEVQEGKRVQVVEYWNDENNGNIVIEILTKKLIKEIKTYNFDSISNYKKCFDKAIILEKKLNTRIQNKMKRSELKEMIKEMMKEEMGIKSNQPQRSNPTPTREPVTIPKEPGTKPDIKPRRRTLQPPEESPNTRPKAEGMIDKISTRFSKLKSVDEGEKCKCNEK